MNIKKQLSNYWNITDKERRTLLKEAYHNQKLSWIQIAEILDTYPNKIRREAKKLGIKSRTKSVAQKEALNTGRSLHPTKGKTLDENTKLKISESQGHIWDNLSPEERLKRSEMGKES